MNLTFYYTENDAACDEVLGIIDSLAKEKPFQLTKVDIKSDFSLTEKYGQIIPFVQIGPYQLRYPVTKTDLLVALNAAEDRQKKLESTDSAYLGRVKRGNEISKTDRFTLWLSRYYAYFLALILAAYVGLPFLAPVLMENKLEMPARVIYTIYSPVCHQLAYRSFFLFGEQPFYPRALAEIPGYKTYEEISGNNPANLGEGRNFLGSPQIGYKVALCERDIAIYGSMLLFTLLFILSGRKIKAIPWYIWVIVGMVPMGLDGGSQLFSLVSGIFPDWFPVRESTPFLRTLTGILFGATTIWYVLPLIEESMIDGRSFILRKVAVINSMDKK